MIETNSERDKHLAWCKKRSLEILKAGDIQGAAINMVGDLGKEECTRPPDSTIFAALNINTVEAAQKFIEGFT